MKYALSVVTGGLLLAVSAIAMAGALDGPLTDQQGLAREQARDQARSVAVERTQSVVADETANVAATEAMPAPVATQFTAKLGGAPVAAASGTSTHQSLPPVVDLTQSARGTIGAAPAPQRNVIDQPDSSSSDLAMSSGSESAPVLSSTGGDAGVSASYSQDGMGARLARIEQQQTNLARMNLPQQINDIQLELQQLSGQLQVQEHDIKLLNKQQRTFYQDLDQRIKKLGSGNTAAASATPSKKVASSNNQLQDSNTYKAAFDQLLKRKYGKAETGLKKYLSDYPNGEFVTNAHYWLGEIYLIKKAYMPSRTEFEYVIANAPKSPRIPDAKFKVGLIQLYQGQRAEARRAFLAVKKAYPESTAAQLAGIQLKQLGS